MTNMSDARTRIKAFLAEWLNTVSDEQIQTLLLRAREEALGEVQHALKEMMVPLLLEQVASQSSQAFAPTSEVDYLVGAQHTVPPEVDHLVGAQHTVPPEVDHLVGAQHTVPPEVDHLVGAQRAAPPVRQSRTEETLPATSLQDEAQQNLAPATIQDEIAAIRRQIEENEAAMHQAHTSTTANPLTSSDEQESQKPDEVHYEEPTDETDEKDKTNESHNSPLIEGTVPEHSCGYYVYAIANTEQGNLPHNLPNEGIDPKSPVYTIAHQSLSAVVSHVPLAEFGQDVIEDYLQDMMWLEDKVYQHQYVLETLLQHQPLIPMRFGAIYYSEERVVEMLTRYHDDFVAALSRLEGKQEWGIKVYCDTLKLKQQIEQQSTRIRTMKHDIESRSSGTAYLMQKKLGDVVAEEIEQCTNDIAQQIHSHLAECTTEAVMNPLQNYQSKGTSSTMVLNGAYLVATNQIDTFRQQVASLRERYADYGIRYDLTGPWAAYNFVHITMQEGEAL